MIEYKGYIAKIDYEPDDRVFFGVVSNIRDLVVFEGETPEEIENNFKAAVDSYLKTCRREGLAADKPLSGRLVLRMPPDLHRAIALKAKAAHKSINEVICDKLALAI